MKSVKFWVDFLLEAGDADVCHRYWFDVDIPDEDFEELRQVWLKNNENHITSWYTTDWDGHNELHDKIDATAYKVLNKILKENEPEFADPVDVFWSLTKETENEF